MNTINVNGVSYTGKSVVVTNGRIVIDGKDATPLNDKIIHININGDVNDLHVDACKTVSITGNAGSVAIGAGDIHCGDITGDVHTGSGDIQCLNVGGDVSTGSGDITCKNVIGNVRTGCGDINRN